MFIYTDLNNNVCQCAIPDDAIEQGVVYKEVPSYEGREFRSALTDVDNTGVPQFDLMKVRNIVHDKRRAKRSIDLAPYDDIISLQIPGSNAAAAEASRQIIRDADAILQISIDTAGEADLRSILFAL